MKYLDIAIRWLALAAAGAAVLALVAMMVHVNLDVLGRVLSNTPLQGTIEIVSHWYMVAIAFLPLAYVERLDGHIDVELLSHLQSPRMCRINMALAKLVAAAFYGLLTYVSLDRALDKWAIGEYAMGSIAFIIWPTRFFIPVGVGLLAIVLMIKSVRILLLGEEPESREAADAP